MNKSIISNERRCFICGSCRNLELHHVFGGANRKRSDKDGLTVYLCHACHNEPPNGVHFNRRNSDRLKALAQERWQEIYNKTKADFIKAYGKNYL